MIAIIFSSQKRAFMQVNLVNELNTKGVDSFVINDERTFGKMKFWIRYKQAIEKCLRSDHNRFMIIPDDITDIDVDAINSILDDRPNIVLSVLTDGRRSCWGYSGSGFKAKYDDYSIFDLGFCDCGIAVNRDVLSKIKIDPIPDSWFDRPDKSSGVGYQLTTKFSSIGVKMIGTYPSLSNHGDHESVMHPDERKKRPLIAIAKPKKLPIIVCIATMKGREKYLDMAVSSLRNQVDEIIIYDNGARPGLTDNGKFYGLTELTGPAYYLSCDDDLIYPITYAKDMVEAIRRTGTIVTHHGRILKGKGLDYYRGHQSFRCLSAVHEERRIDVAGTGVCGFDTRYFNPVGIHKAKDKRMSDLVFSLRAAEEEKIITLLKHQSGYIREAGVPFNETIAGQDIDKAGRQIEIADEIYERIYNSHIGL